MAGDIKAKFGTQGTLTFTSFNSQAGSSTFLAGSSSLAVDNTTDVALDYIVSAKITWSTTAPAAGTYRLDMHVYGSLNDTPDYPLDGSGNALGTDVDRSFATDGDKANSAAWWASLTLAATASKVYTQNPKGIALQCFGGRGSLPKYWGMWAVHGVTTASSTPASSGNTVWYMPVLAQYT